MLIPVATRKKGCKTHENQKYLRHQWQAKINFIKSQTPIDFKISCDYGTYQKQFAATKQQYDFEKHQSYSFKTPHCQFIKFVTCTYFKKEQSYNFKVTYCQKRILKNFRLIDDKDQTIELRINDDQIPSILSNQKLITKPQAILKAYEVLSIFKKLLHKESVFLTVFENYFFTDTSDYYLARNPILHQMPIDPGLLTLLYKQHVFADYYDYVDDDFELPQANKDFIGNDERLNRRRRVLYHLKNGNTNKAVDAYLEGNQFPKSIRMLLLKFTIIPKYQLDIIAETIKTLDINIVRAILEHYHHDQTGAIQKAVSVMTLSKYFSYKHLIRNDRYIVDVLRMLSHLQAIDSIRINQRIDDTIKSTKHIKTLHDRFIKIMNDEKYGNNAAWDEPFVSKITHFEDTQTQLIVRPVATINELDRLGTALSICVGSYRQEQYFRRLEIFIVTNKENHYLACLEVDNYKLVQAKLKYNKPVKENKAIDMAVKAWAKSNKFRISTQDL